MFRFSLRRRAFTLIELLVVIAIIAILIALLVPAVQKVREAAARAQCMNNLKQLALGCQNYHDVYKTLPPAVLNGRGIGWTDENNIGPNWVVLILPYIEQGPLYNQVVTSITNYKAFAVQTGATGSNDQNWRNVRSSIIPIMRCPSESNSDVMGNRSSNNWARGNYAANNGPGGFPGNTNGTSNADGFGWQGGGPMNINFGIRLGVLANQDGSSNTILINHLRCGPAANDMRGTWAFGEPGCSITAARAIGDCYTPNDTGCCSDDVRGCNDRPDIAMGCWNGDYGQGQARSEHTGGVTAAAGDGSVRFVSNAISQAQWYIINSRNDGQTITFNW